MKNRVLEIINSKNYKRMKKNDFKRELNIIDENEYHCLVDTLDELKDEGILWTNKGKYDLASRMGVYKGKLSLKPQGYGFINFGEETDIFVPHVNLHNAMNNDTVIFRYQFSPFDNRPEADILRIVERGTKVLVGRIEEKDGKTYLIRDNEKNDVSIIVVKNDIKAQVNHIVRAVVLEYNESLFVEVIEILGHVNDPGMDILQIVYDHNIDIDFPKTVLDEVSHIEEEVSEEEIKRRVDLRDRLVVTIDGDDAKDLDDAVTLSILPNGNYQLGVYIADVSYYVKKGSFVDKEAYHRGTSVYLVDRVIPMLPHILSNGICSLNPGVNRLVICCDMEIDSLGNVVKHKIFPGVIKTTERMTYNNVNKVLDSDEEMLHRYQNLVPMFKNMAILRDILKNRRDRRGSIDFETAEAKILVDEKGVPLDIKLRERGLSEMIIEEFMLVANETVAEHVNRLNLPFIYRVHEEPDPVKLAKTINIIKTLGYELKFNKSRKIEPMEVQNLLLKLIDKPEEKAINTLMLRSMMKARYSEFCLGHYGLAAKYYTHFTSPIRRYPDTLVHRMLREFIFEEKTDEKNLNEWNEALPKMALSTSNCEREAIECERDVSDMKKAEYMESHIGEEFTGVVSGLTNFGMFIELDNTIEGLVHVATMLDDYYEFNDEMQILVGLRKKQYYRIGDYVKIKVEKASKDIGQIDFTIIEQITKHHLEKKKSTKKRR